MVTGGSVMRCVGWGGVGVIISRGFCIAVVGVVGICVRSRASVSMVRCGIRWRVGNRW